MYKINSKSSELFSQNKLDFYITLKLMGCIVLPTILQRLTEMKQMAYPGYHQ